MRRAVAGALSWRWSFVSPSCTRAPSGTGVGGHDLRAPCRLAALATDQRHLPQPEDRGVLLDPVLEPTLVEPRLPQPDGLCPEVGQRLPKIHSPQSRSGPGVGA